jgi:hypothetical protein
LAASGNNTKFFELRKKYPFFIYEDFIYNVDDTGLHIVYHFNLADKFKFSPKISFLPNKAVNIQNIPVPLLENLIFHIGMIEMISYWKAACPPKIMVKPFYLEARQLQWWKNLYYKGMGEFFYLNGITTDAESFVRIESSQNRKLTKTDIITEPAYLVPVGGGKDSAITLEILKKENSVTPFVINPRKAIDDCIATAGFSSNESVTVLRSIHPQLLQLNKLGFLNGHTPFSALLAFVSLLASALSGKKNIALSNESSANESTVKGSFVNHQYSKTFSFERDFRSYVNEYITGSINYFSFLRPLHEIQIASVFSSMPKYFPGFKSCNAGSKKDEWCCNCPKCLFTYIILSPFLDEGELKKIFGENLLDKAFMEYYLNQLTGNEPVKPFECVGTIEEVNVALIMTMKKYSGKLPLLLQDYKESHAYFRYKDVAAETLIKKLGNEHFLSPAELEILKKYV